MWNSTSKRNNSNIKNALESVYGVYVVYVCVCGIVCCKIVKSDNKNIAGNVLVTERSILWYYTRNIPCQNKSVHKWPSTEVKDNKKCNWILVTTKTSETTKKLLYRSRSKLLRSDELKRQHQTWNVWETHNSLSKLHLQGIWKKNKYTKSFLCFIISYALSLTICIL